MPKEKIPEDPASEKEEEPLKDRNYRGPVTNRSCTDIICCIIFIIFIVAFAAVAIFAYVKGDYKLLLYPMDSENNLCGLGNMKDKPYLLFSDITRCISPIVFLMGCPTPQICVKKCPNKTEPLPKQYCSDVNIPEKDCPPYVIQSKDLVNRCVPDITVLGKAALHLKDAYNHTVKDDDLISSTKMMRGVFKAKAYAEQIINDVMRSWWIILVALIITMFVSLLWIFLMRWIAGIMVWLGVIGFLVLFAAGCGVAAWKYTVYKDSDEIINIGFNPLLFTVSKAKFYLWTSIITGVVFLIFLLILLVLFSRIRIAIALIKEGSRAVGSIMSTLLWPIIPFILQIGVIFLWLSVAVHLYSINRSVNSTESVDIISQVESFCSDLTTNETNACSVMKTMESYTIYLQIYALFMFFWLVNFVSAMGQLTLAGAFASYYWSFNKPDDIPSLPLLKSFWRCFRYHFGSLAFGSLLIAIVQMIRLLLEYLDHKLKDVENPVAKFILKCMRCCFWCLEKFLKFLNKNAYIMIAVHGKNFCVSAKDAFKLIFTNIARTAVIDKSTSFVLFLSRLAIVCAIGFASYVVFGQKISLDATKYIDDLQLNFHAVPIVIIIIGTYIITSLFFSVYDMAVDTLFLCFLEDLDVNDGSAEKPYFMSKQLMSILGKNNKETEK
ncbi:choline transporter-like protein 2 isoform X2 [Octopus bimaculoides]|uniref:choline transporter-like protein 2 isoform X2 n=1 Tax=Octopus bimaculoides TaxID=37653 RepID=UPI00071D6A5B|nr:choline transporter-like protein 2 isoform X2 [Octopus bimaculoides]|eukprot:XP_014770495.1 PREDICTED: choline transporter-like protein 2 isoform X1 [Octopus bimaculoides]